MLLSIASRPEWMIVLPIKILSWGQLYVAYLANRMLARVEAEVASALFSGACEATAGQPQLLSSDAHGNPVGHQFPMLGAIQQWPTIGWVVALCAWARQH